MSALSRDFPWTIFLSTCLFLDSSFCLIFFVHLSLSLDISFPSLTFLFPLDISFSLLASPFPSAPLLYFILCSLLFVLYSLLCTLYSLLSTFYSIPLHCTQVSFPGMLSSLQRGRSSWTACKEKAESKAPPQGQPLALRRFCGEIGTLVVIQRYLAKT